MVDTTMGGMLHLDSGASFYMTGNRDLFSDFEEKDLKQNIKFGDDKRHRATKISTIRVALVNALVHQLTINSLLVPQTIWN